jgi:UDP:flavonoid glycosyltransferase YjiC (YdhE family)
VTLGGVFSPKELVAPANVTVVRSAPHGAVLPLSRVVIAHGGHGTVIKSLGHGKPVLCLPLGRDQKDNAARVEAAGAGLRLSAGASTAKLAARWSASWPSPTSNRRRAASPPTSRRTRARTARSG